MIRQNDVRDLLESHCGGDRRQFVRTMLESMGLRDEYGNIYRDAAGNQTLRNPRVNGAEQPRIQPREMSLESLGRGILGHDLFESYFTPGSTRLAADMPAIMAERHLLEAGEGAVQASAFANINAFTAVVVGLLEVSVLVGWENPAFIGDKLMPDEPTKMFDGRKVIGGTRIGDQAEERQPGMPTKRVQIGERWVTQPRTVENALASEVTQEAVFLDLTGDVTRNATDVGTWLRYRKELRQIDAFIGVTNTFSYKGTSYNTYQTASTWDNDFSNELFHYTQVQLALIKFRDMKDPDTGTRVLIQPNMMLVQREKLLEAQAILTASNVQYRDASTSASYIREYPNPIAGKFQLIESPLVYERITAADGLNIAAANAAKYWWLFESGSNTIVYAQNWPLRVQQAAPGQVDMIDRGIVLYVKADERGIPMWKEPRRVVRSKN